MIYHIFEYVLGNKLSKIFAAIVFVMVAANIVFSIRRLSCSISKILHTLTELYAPVVLPFVLESLSEYSKIIASSYVLLLINCTFGIFYIKIYMVKNMYQFIFNFFVNTILQEYSRFQKLK